MSLIDVRLGSIFWFNLKEDGTYKKIGQLIGGEDGYYEVEELEDRTVFIIWPWDVFELIKY